MICILAMVVFSILGIFSARYRSLAKEAFECVFKRIRLKPCESGLDQKVKSKIIGKVFKRNKKLAGVLNRYFEVFSWALVILLIVSMGFTANGLFNYFVFGNCNGPNADPGSCFLPTGGSKKSLDYEKISLSELNYSDNSYVGPKDAKVTIFEFGCFQCPYTKSIQSELEKLMEKYRGDIKLVFMHFPLAEHHNSQLLAQAAVCAQRQGKFWEYKKKLFTIQGSCEVSNESNPERKPVRFATSIGLKVEKFKSCIDSKDVKKEVLNDKRQGLGLGVKQTPTLFINDRKVEGYRSYKELKQIVEEELNSS